MKVFFLLASLILASGVVSANNSVLETCGDVPFYETLDSTESAYAVPCDHPTPTVDRRYVKSDFFTVFKTWEEAEANCNYRDYVQGVYNWRFRFIGYSCAPGGIENDNGGGGGA